MNNLIQLGKKIFIPSAAMIQCVSYSDCYPKDTGTLRVEYKESDKQFTLQITDPEDQKTALKVFRKTAARVVVSTPEIDFWLNIK